MTSIQHFARTVGLANPLSPVPRLLQKLPPESQVMLRKLSSVLVMPVDAPAFLPVLTTAQQAVISYRKTLITPTNKFLQIMRMLDELADGGCCILKRAAETDEPLRRRLLKNASWALFFEMSSVSTPESLLIAAGVELAYCLATNKSFPNGYATNLRRALRPTLDFLHPAENSNAGEPAWLPHFRKTNREARKLFEEGSPPPEADQNANFNEVAIKTLRGASLLPSIRHRQGVLDRSHLSLAMLVASSEVLRNATANGCDNSTLATLAFLSGLPLGTTLRIPLAGTDDDWVMQVDVEAGILRTDLDRVFPKAAHPRGHSAHRSASRVIAKPLPQFLANALWERMNKAPDALCVADLLQQADCDGSRLTLANEKFGIEPSVARFIHTGAGFAINRGIDRLTAAVLTNDFGVIPASKVYYCHINQGQIWEAAETFYAALNWGSPTRHSKGLAFGSRIVPSREAIREWYRWLGSELDRLRPGKNCRIEPLLRFHNRFAEVSAAIAVFCLASRGTARVRLTADALTGNADSILLFDKRVGYLPRSLPVPVSPIVSTQAKLWRAHCRALDKRLKHKGISPTSSIRQRLQGVVNQARVEMFFRIDAKLSLQPISCHSLAHSWPSEFGFSADFGRHFWESELRLVGVKSTVIDLLLRHQVAGTEGHRSTGDRSVASSFAEITSAQGQVLQALGIKPIIGLAKV